MKLIEMYKNKRSVQETLSSLGKEGCYFLSIVALCEEINGREIDPYRAFDNAVLSKHVDADGFVRNPIAIVKELTGLSCKVNKRSNTYKITTADYVIAKYKYYEDKTLIAHFVLLDINKQIMFDPWYGSRTVRLGVIDSWRVFTFDEDKIKSVNFI